MVRHARGKVAYRQYAGLAYIAPWLIGFIGLQLYPLAMSLYYAFCHFSLLKEPVFAGFYNFAYAMTSDPDFWQAVKVTAVWALLAVPGKLTVALLVAMLMNQKLRFINLYRSIYYLPSIFGASVAISVLWRFLFMKQGLINNLIAYLGIPAQDWLGSARWALLTVNLVNIWQFGSSMVLFLAGLKQIPAELYEASLVDGANARQRFVRITLPMLSPIILFNLIMQMVNALQDFTAPFVVTGGGPMRATYLYALMIYNNAFRYFKMGYASALSWILFAFIILLTLLIFQSSARWAYYEDGRVF